MTNENVVFEENFGILDSFLKNLDLESIRNKYHQLKMFENIDFDKSEKKHFLIEMDKYKFGSVMEFDDFCDVFIAKNKKSLRNKMVNAIAPNTDVFGEARKNVSNQLIQPNAMMFFMWQHIRARIYRMWFSVLTEMHAAMGADLVSKGKGIEHSIVNHVDLDVVGIDFVVIRGDNAYPCQIKKESFSKVARGKDNSKENFARKTLNDRAIVEFNRVLNKVVEKKDWIIHKSCVIKYGVVAKDNMFYRIDTKTSSIGDDKPEYVKFKEDFNYLTIEDNGIVLFEPVAFNKLLQKEILCG